MLKESAEPNEPSDKPSLEKHSYRAACQMIWVGEATIMILWSLAASWNGMGIIDSIRAGPSWKVNANVMTLEIDP